VADIIYDKDGPRLGNEKVIYTAAGDYDPEPQDFRNNDQEVIMAEYHEPSGRREEWYCTVKGVNIGTGEVKLYISEPHVHNECEGIFPDENYICLESSRDFPDKGTTDLWQLKLDGSMERRRMTRMIDRYPWRATNSNVSPDGKWLAFMLNILGTEPGYGMGLGLMDLEAWGKSEYAAQWEKPQPW
jgi:Tol biopolymer transport system component